MADRRLLVAPPAPELTATLTASGQRRPLTASAFSDTSAERTAQTQYMNIGWQNTAWLYYSTIGPLNYGLNWLSNCLGRVALTIAEVQPGNEEPEILESGPAVDVLHQLKWDESAIMSDLALQLSVPGRGYLVGREIAPKVQEWCVYSPSQIRPAANGRGWDWELWEYGKQWIPLDNALVAVVRDADDRYTWLDTSTTRGALTVLREIDLYDREIVSSLVSRIATNGILLVPQEVTFPSRQQFNDNQDPFMDQLIESARQSIKDPGSASAAIPLPLKVPSQFIEKFRHIILASGVEETVLNARKQAIGILADSVNIPKEIMLGMGDVNHSSGLAQDLEESAIKTHISPLAELICRGLTRGFLYPQLTAAGEKLTGPNGGRLVVWYDTSALAAKPDLSKGALDLYDRGEISGDALRKYVGVTEDDAPTKEQLRTQLLIKAAAMAQHALTAIAELTGEGASFVPKSTDQMQDSPPGNGVIEGDKPGDEKKIPAQRRPLASVS